MISLQGVSKAYKLGDTIVPVLRGVSLEIAPGQFIAITGPSGSGKSTLMNILGLLESYDSGSYRFWGHDVSTMTDDQLAGLRNQRIGFVFQLFNLIPRLNALRNVEIPLMYAGVGTAERRHRAQIALQLVGLGERMDHTASQLSGGQQQRVAIARALVTDPEIIIADEPTGSLDSQTSHDIMALLQTLNQSGKTVILVTHEDEIAAYASRIIYLRDGEIRLDHQSTT